MIVHRTTPILALAALLAAAPGARAEEKIETADGIRVTLPDGWQITRDGERKLDLTGPTGPDGPARASARIQDVDKMSEDQYFDMMGRFLTVIDRDAKSERIDRGGQKWMIVDAKYADDDGKEYRSRSHAALVGKRGVMLQTSAPAGDFDLHAKDFEALFASFALGDPDPRIPRRTPEPEPEPEPPAPEPEPAEEPPPAPTPSPAIEPDPLPEPAPAAEAKPPAPVPSPEPEPTPEEPPVVDESPTEPEAPPPPREPDQPRVDPRADSGEPQKLPPWLEEDGEKPAQAGRGDDGAFRIERLRVSAKDDAERAAPRALDDTTKLEVSAGGTITIRLNPRGTRLNDKGEHWIEAGVKVIDAWDRAVVDQPIIAEHVARAPRLPKVAAVTMRVEIPGDFPPAEYRMVVLVRDRLAQQTQRAEVPLVVGN